VAAVIENDDRFLMVEEADAAGNRVINQPAGHLESQESLHRAVCREVMEETGWAFSPAGLVGVYKWRLPARDLTYIRYCYYGTAEPHAGDWERDPDILDVHWLTAAEILDAAPRHRSPMVQRCLIDYLNRQRFGLDLIHELD